MIRKTGKKFIGVLMLILCLLLFNLASCSMLASEIFTDQNDDIDIEYYVPTPQGTLPIGMNLPSITYYDPSNMFTDVMCTASGMLSTYTGGSWDTGLSSEFNVDDDGYVIGAPQTLSDGHDSFPRFLISDHYSAGKYRIYFDGEGTLAGNVRSDAEGYYIELDGKGGNRWIDVTYSNPVDYIRNMHILPEDISIDDWNSGNADTFTPAYVEGLKDMNSLRFMDLMRTNNSRMRNWDDRATKTNYTQTTKGIAYEYIIELAEDVGADIWICVPHMASDDYISQMAQFFYDNCPTNIKIYLEFSNEIWNWQFLQTQWISANGDFGSYTEPVDSYIASDLAQFGDYYYYKNAYMMARTFRIWNNVFGTGTDRLIRVGSGQQAFPGMTKLILEYLFNTDGVGCDMFAVGGYFGLPGNIHADWLELLSDGGRLTNLRIYRDITDYLDGRVAGFITETKQYTDMYGVDYIVYEGGQHLQPYEQKEWDYNETLYDFQISQEIYNLYVNNFNKHIDVDCKLFMAFSYIGVRESKYGSWGHLESIDQIGGNYLDAPKFRALLDMNVK